MKRKERYSMNMNIIKNIDENKCVVKLKGRLDTTTVSQLEKELEEIDPTKELVFDFEDLEYISSAGLRVILKFKKLNDTTKVINCNSEVYDIFTMTGFADFMDVSKAFRKLSVDGCEVIGKGFYGTVYRFDEETIVKVYKEGSQFDLIKKEIDLSRKAFVLGIPTAIPYDIVKVGDLYGAVFELINSKLVQEMIVEGEDLEKIVKDLVDILKKIHSIKIDDDELPSRKDVIMERVDDCKSYLPKDIWEKLKSLVNDIPEAHTLIHGDFHIKNIMKQNDELLIIDMATISFGHPILELSAIYATYFAFACVDKNNTQQFLGIPYEQSKKILQLTFQYYFNDKTSEYIDDVMYKASILAYVQVLWIRSNYTQDNQEIQKQEIEFCKNYLIQNVPKVDSLVF